MNSDEAVLNNYFDTLGINKAAITAKQAELVFKCLVDDLLNNKISDTQFGDIAGDLLYAHKITNRLEKELPELAGLLTFASEISWDKENYPTRYKNTMKKILLYAHKKTESN